LLLFFQSIIHSWDYVPIKTAGYQGGSPFSFKYTCYVQLCYLIKTRCTLHAFPATFMNKALLLHLSIVLRATSSFILSLFLFLIPFPTWLCALGSGVGIPVELKRFFFRRALGRSVDYSSASSAEVKNEWSYTHTPPICPNSVEDNVLPLLCV
jgi:hypothetical protein